MPLVPKKPGSAPATGSSRARPLIWVLYVAILATCGVVLASVYAPKLRDNTPQSESTMAPLPERNPEQPEAIVEENTVAEPINNVARPLKPAPEIPETPEVEQPPREVAVPDTQPAAAESQTPIPKYDPDEKFPGVVVCVDPGHPSETNPGRAVQNGVTELDMVWQVSQVLIPLLRKHELTVVSTKQEKDELVTNRRRAEICNEAGAVIFIRLHCDTQSGKPTRKGFTLYYPDGKGTKHGRTGPTDYVIKTSKPAAVAIHAGMLQVLDGILVDNGLRGESKTYIGGKQGALTGSIFAEVPAVTVEMLFLSHPDDAAFIKSQRGQQILALSLTNGVINYLRTLYD